MHDVRRRLQQAEARVEWIDVACRPHIVAAQRGDGAARETLARYERDRAVAESDVVWLRHELWRAEHEGELELMVARTIDLEAGSTA